MDPYVYPQTNILINKLGIQNEQELITIEAQFLIAGIIDIHSIADQIDFCDFTSIQKIHRYLFQSLYVWSGEFRTINIFKSERILGGLSIIYSNKDQIQHDLTHVFKWANKIDWTSSNTQLASNFVKFMTDLWRIHPFREGNTRTVSIFIKLFADYNSIEFNEQLLSQNAAYLRNALVLAAVEEAPEIEHLDKIITDALGFTRSHSSILDNSTSEKYQSIRDYDVSTYEEKPFTMDSDIDKTDK
ncbi:fic/DOC family protein [Planococcus antarcticus DSM 14505]|uniref:protein adenylyltransferase n=1 Tax=Planococcus antarcticus DSM 14505 TaxID=1185653 RepID=A0ABM6D9F7_9BACL|nr:Fic family protein [Planococcus antarcticus]ANU11968.1 fic/DOC family protein [Planococcus antarcticus DSM 14505]